MKTIEEKSIIIDYIKNLKIIIDNLILISYPSSDEEVTVRTLSSLRDEYKKLVTTIRARDSSMLFE